MKSKSSQKYFIPIRPQ